MDAISDQLQLYTLLLFKLARIISSLIIIFKLGISVILSVLFFLGKAIQLLFYNLQFLFVKYSM